MINELLLIGSLIISFFLVLLVYRLFGKIGLYVWIAIAVILANIQVMKTVEIFGLVTALGNVVYSSIFLVTDILNENYSKKEAQKAVWIGFFVLLSVTIIMQLTIQFIPHETDELSPAISEIFSFFPRIAFASIVAYIISQSHDVWFFAKLKKRDKGKRLWLRNNLSTIISQTIDNLIFTAIVFVGEKPFEIIVSIFVTSLLLKLIVATCDTPFIYWSRKIKKTIKEDN